jgi:hypothetical protein
LLGVGQWQHGFFGVDGRKSKGFMVVLMTENVEFLMDKKKKAFCDGFEG